MKILAVNWLDRDNPQAGGAELHFFELFGRLVARGHRVTLVTSGFRGAAPRAEIAGIDVRRRGGRYGFALRARGAVRQALHEEPYDVVVEDINKLPLYTPTLTSLPICVIVPHLFGTTAFREASWPVATLVWLAELPIPAVYRRAAFHAISDSTRDDLVRRGIARARIRVIYPGVDTGALTPDPAVPRAAEPTFLYVGRLKRYKGVDTAVRAVALARTRGCALRLDIAGEGDDRGRLAALVQRLGLGDAVRFRGFVSERDKRELRRRAGAVVLPSAKEGWGISNVEAAAGGMSAGESKTFALTFPDDYQGKAVAGKAIFFGAVYLAMMALDRPRWRYPALAIVVFGAVVAAENLVYFAKTGIWLYQIHVINNIAAITAPVFPAEMNACARPSRCSFRPTGIDERGLARIAASGLSAMAITSGASTTCTRWCAPPPFASSASTSRARPTSRISADAGSVSTASSAPATGAWGAKSPPMASSAIRTAIRLPRRPGPASSRRSSRRWDRRGAAAWGRHSADRVARRRARPCSGSGACAFSPWRFCASGLP